MKMLSILLLASVPFSLQESKNAEDLLQEALALAKESKRKVFLTFGSPG